MIYVDTHVLLWLLSERQLLSDAAQSILRSADRVHYSPMVELELQYLHEIGRIREDAALVLTHLRAGLDLQVCPHPFVDVVAAAKHLTWTRDPFDRLITAQATITDATLLTADTNIRTHYARAVW